MFQEFFEASLKLGDGIVEVPMSVIHAFTLQANGLLKLTKSDCKKMVCHC